MLINNTQLAWRGETEVEKERWTYYSKHQEENKELCDAMKYPTGRAARK